MFSVLKNFKMFTINTAVVQLEQQYSKIIIVGVEVVDKPAAAAVSTISTDHYCFVQLFYQTLNTVKCSII